MDAAWDDGRRLVVVGGRAEAWMGMGARTVAGNTGGGGGRKGTEAKGVRKGSAGVGKKGSPGRRAEPGKWTKAGRTPEATRKGRRKRRF